MNRQEKFYSVFLMAFLVCTLALFTTVSNAQYTLAYDDANDGVYADWDHGDDGGSGFGAWALGVTGSAGHFRGTSGSIDVNSNSWGMWANSGGVSDAVRSFDSNLQSGDTFYISMDNGFIDNGNSVGWELRNASNESVFWYQFYGGDSYYTFADDGNSSQTGVGWANSGWDITLELLTASTYQLKIYPAGNSTPSATLNGTFNNPANGQTITNLRLWNSNAGSGSDHDLFYNKIKVTNPTVPVELDKFEIE